MKAFTILEIRQIINGDLIQGTDDLVIDYIPPYKKIRSNKKNVLIFQRGRNSFDLLNIQLRLPCAIVVDAKTNQPQYQNIKGLTIIWVDDVKVAYWKFVDYYRGLFDIPVVSVTGTCGKTTTKDIITHILKETKSVQSTYSSANARTAHLHYLIGIEESTEAAVFETAVGSPGDVTLANRYFKPNIGIITNIGACHLTGCKTIEGYIKAKGEMVTSLGKDSVLILNADDEKTNTLNLKNFSGKILYFGIKNNADFQATDIEYGNNGMIFTLKTIENQYPVFIPGYGEHQIYNALAALAVTSVMKVDLRRATNRLKSFKNPVRHTEIFTGIKGATIIDDTWNFNTTSLKAGMEVLNHVANGKRKIALFTDMASLGNYEEELHKEAGEIIRQFGADVILTIGNLAKDMALHAKSLGLNCTIQSFTNYEELYEQLVKLLNKDSSLYIKSFGNNLNMIEIVKKLIRKGHSNRD